MNRSSELGTRNSELGTEIPFSSAFRVPRSAFRAPSSEFRVPSSAFRVPRSAFLLPFHGHDEVPLAQPQCQVDGFGQARPQGGAGHQAVDDHFDVVPHLAVEPQIVGQGHDVAVDARPHEALLEQILEQIAVFTFLPADERREHPARSRLLFGLAHFYLLWWGDILANYALVGMIAFVFWRLKPKWLLLAAALCYWGFCRKASSDNDDAMELFLRAAAMERTGHIEAAVIAYRTIAVRYSRLPIGRVGSLH